MISAEKLSTHIVLGFVGSIVNIIVSIQGAPDPTFRIGASLAVTPAP